MKHKNWKRSKKVSRSLMFMLFFFIIISIFMNNINNSKVETSSVFQNEKFAPLAGEPVIDNVTANAEYFKDGDFIELFVNCDQANYSLLANFSTIDDVFTPGDEKVLDYNNGTYRINYTLDLSNSRPDGSYQIVINATNTTSSQFTLNNSLYLTLDNAIPTLYVTTPQLGANITTYNVTIEGFMNATGSKIKYVTVFDPRFEFLINHTGEETGNFLIANKSEVSQGNISLKIGVNDSVDLFNYVTINFTLDNTIPNITGSVFSQDEELILISGTAKGTFSRITNFIHNISQFSIQGGTDPVGKLEQYYILGNPGQPISDGRYTLNITLTDSVNFTNNVFVPFMVDNTPPTYNAILQNISEPEYYHDVNISIVNPQDTVSGIKNITFYYSTTNGSSWNQINITETHYGIIPNFDYLTNVSYQINLTDNYGNVKASDIFSYTVEDYIPPVLGNIQRTPSNPTKFTEVNISIDYAYDLGAGLANIYINYSIDGGISWDLIDITANKWGIIEPQPRGLRVFYQIIVIDEATNEYKSEITSYVVILDYTRLLIFLLILAVVAVISSYSVKKIYSKIKQKNLNLRFSVEKEEFKTYVDFRLSEIEINLTDINTIGMNLDNLLQFQWVPQSTDLKHNTPKNYRLVREYIGITQLSTEITDLKTNLDTKIKEIEKVYHPIRPLSQLSHDITRFHKKLDALIIALGDLNETLRSKYPLYRDKVKSPLKIEFSLDTFDQKFAKIINEFQEKYEILAKEIDQLLISRKVKLLEERLDKLQLIFKETDEWLENAQNWSKVIPLPKDRGYKYLLKLKKEQYLSVKDEFGLKIEKFRAELMSSISFAQNFIKWNLNNLKSRLKKLETLTYEDAIRYISSEDTEIANINAFLEEKFSYFDSLLKSDRTKIDEFYDSHKDFSIQELYDEWTAVVRDIPSKLEAIRNKLEEFTRPIYRVFKLIKGITVNFRLESMVEINKHANVEESSELKGKKLTPLNILFSRTVWKINRIDNELKDWIDLLPFDLETPQLMILLRDWNMTKEEIFEKLNTLSKEQKIYKCEIMHEILDPLNDEIWECSNCGAIVCTDHLEKWYHRKKAPECFKCGKTSTFKLKILTE